MTGGMNRFFLAGFVSACTLAAQSTPGTGAIQGHVVNAVTSVPVRRATVILTSPQVRLVAATDAQGTFQFTALPPGTYRLSGARAGFLDHPARRPIILGPNDQFKDAEIRLPPQSVLAGHVLDEEGEPVDRARVWIYKQVYRESRKSWDRLNTAPETNERGEYRFPNLTPGRYLLQALDQRPPVDSQFGNPPKSVYVPAYYPNAVTQLQAAPVLLGVGAEVNGIDIHLFKVARPPSVRVRGRAAGISSGSGTIVAVNLAPSDGSLFGYAGAQASPPDYVFDLRVPPGQYTLTGSVYSGLPDIYGTATLTVTGDVEGAQLIMRPVPQVTGRISFAEGGQGNLANVTVVLAALSANLPSGDFQLRSDAAGRLSPFPPALSRPAHFTLVNVRSLPEGYFVQEMKLAGQAISPDDFEIQSSAELEIILGNTAAKITGAVTDADSKPVPGSIVILISADGKSRPAKQQADDSGNFQFANLRPGSYKLFAWEDVDDDLWPDPEFRAKYDSRAADVTVGPREMPAVQLRVIEPAGIQ